MLLQLTTKCLENCSHCMVSASPDGIHMSDSVFQNALFFIHDIGFKNVQVTGGEFTLHPKFYEHCSALRECTNATIVLESNGSFIYDDVKYEQVKKLLTRENIFLQVRTHPKYYPNYSKIWEHPKIKELTPHFYNDAITLLPFGRAIQNHKNEINWNSRPSCCNMFLTNQQSNSLQQAIKLMEEYAFFCKPLVAVNGDIHVGETAQCVKVGNVITDTAIIIHNNLKNKKPCGKCGLLKNIPDTVKKFLISEEIKSLSKLTTSNRKIQL